jgi:hypothetical protein
MQNYDCLLNYKEFILEYSKVFNPGMIEKSVNQFFIPFDNEDIQEKQCRKRMMVGPINLEKTADKYKKEETHVIFQIQSQDLQTFSNLKFNSFN